MLSNGSKEDCNDDLCLCFVIFSDEQSSEKDPCTGSKELLSLDTGIDLHYTANCDAEEREDGNSVVPYAVAIMGSGDREMANGTLGNRREPLG